MITLDRDWQGMRKSNVHDSLSVKVLWTTVPKRGKEGKSTYHRDRLGVGGKLRRQVDTGEGTNLGTLYT